MSNVHVKPRRFRLRMSLRTLMLVILAIAVGLGWTAELVRRQRAAIATVKRLGGEYHYDYEFVNDRLVPGKEPSEPSWQIRLLGVDFFHDVVEVYFTNIDKPKTHFYDEKSTDTVVRMVRYLPRLRRLGLVNGTGSDAVLERMPALEHLTYLCILDDTAYTNKLSDAGAKNITKFKNMKILLITGSSITDDGLITLGKMNSIQTLSCFHWEKEGEHFSDRGVAGLRKMKKLKCLWLDSGPYSIDDAGIENIAAIENLEQLMLRDSQITDRGLERLAKIPRATKIILYGNKKLTHQGINQFKNARPDVDVTVSPDPHDDRPSLQPIRPAP